MVEETEELGGIVPFPAGVVDVFEAFVFDLIGDFMEIGKAIAGGGRLVADFFIESR